MAHCDNTAASGRESVNYCSIVDRCIFAAARTRYSSIVIATTLSVSAWAAR